MIDINTPDEGKCFYAALYGETGVHYSEQKLRHENQISHIFEGETGAFTNANHCIVIPTYDRSIIKVKSWDSANSTWDNPVLIDTPFRYVGEYETDLIKVGDINSDTKLNDVLAKLGVVTGSYTGNGATTRTIELDFTPSAVLVIRSDGVTKDNTAIVGGLAVTNSPVKSADELYAVAIVENGFTVARNAGVNTNMSVTTYNYVAFK